MPPDPGILAAPFAAASTVLAYSGLTKLARPAPAARTLALVGLPSGRGAVRALGLVELMVGAVALVTAQRVAAVALALVYGALAAFAVSLLRRAPDADCGCFGASSAPVGAAHVVVDVVAAAVALVVAIAPFGSLADVLADQPLAGVPFAVLTALLAWLTVVTMTDLTALARAAREGVR
jgi:hypothetical protein